MTTKTYTLCRRCRRDMPPREGVSVCEGCEIERDAGVTAPTHTAAWRRAYQRNWRAANRERLRLSQRARKERGETPRVLKRRRANARRWHAINKARVHIQTKARDRRIRLECLAHYGTACACCGESRFEFLSFDHENGRGSEHRRADRTACDLARWLKRNGFPIGFRTLCMNCNWSRGRLGYCPHERERDQDSHKIS